MERVSGGSRDLGSGRGGQRNRRAGGSSRRTRHYAVVAAVHRACLLNAAFWSERLCCSLGLFARAAGSFFSLFETFARLLVFGLEHLEMLSRGVCDFLGRGGFSDQRLRGVVSAGVIGSLFRFHKNFLIHLGCECA